MENKKITYWQDKEFFLGYVNNYPEYVTQGYTIEELIDNLKDIISDVEQEIIPGKRQILEIVI